MLLKWVFVATGDVVSVGVAGVDVVLVDEAPEDLSEGDAAGWEAEGRRIGEMPRFLRCAQNGGGSERSG